MRHRLSTIVMFMQNISIEFSVSHMFYFLSFSKTFLALKSISSNTQKHSCMSS